MDHRLRQHIAAMPLWVAAFESGLHALVCGEEGARRGQGGYYDAAHALVDAAEEVAGNSIVRTAGIQSLVVWRLQSSLDCVEGIYDQVDRESCGGAWQCGYQRRPGERTGSSVTYLRSRCLATAYQHLVQHGAMAQKTHVLVIGHWHSQAMMTRRVDGRLHGACRSIRFAGRSAPPAPLIARHTGRQMRPTAQQARQLRWGSNAYLQRWRIWAFSILARLLVDEPGEQASRARDRGLNHGTRHSSPRHLTVPLPMPNGPQTLFHGRQVDAGHAPEQPPQTSTARSWPRHPLPGSSDARDMNVQQALTDQPCAGADSFASLGLSDQACNECKRRKGGAALKKT